MALTRTQLLARNMESERKADWFQFLRHSYDGSGGFAPIIPSQEVSGTGSIAQMPSWWNGDSYLLKHEGEELGEWYDRILRARYPNHPRKAIRAWTGLLLRRPPTRLKDKADPALARFLLRADGGGRPWDTVLREACNRGILGGCLSLVDRPNDVGAMNRMQANGPAFVMHIDPDALYEWSLDPWGRFEWAKIVEQMVEQPSPDVAPLYFWRCRIWYRETWETWLMPQDGSEEPVLQGEGLNLLGEVPLVVLTFDDAVGRDLFGWTPADELSQIGRSDFQGISRHDELLERQGFAILERPCREGEENKVSQMDIGAARAVATPMESSRGMAYCAPPDGPVASHERKHDSDRNEGLRVMNLEQLLSSTAAPASALERQYEFQTLNADLTHYSQRAAHYEREVERLVMLFDGATPEAADAAVDQLAVEWPDDFNIRDQPAIVDLMTRVAEMPGVDSVTQMAAVRQARDAAVQMSDEEKKASDDELLATMRARQIQPPPPPTWTAVGTPGAAAFDAGATAGAGPEVVPGGQENVPGMQVPDDQDIGVKRNSMLT